MINFSSKNSRPLRDLVAGFEDGTLPREEWTHAAHLTMALWYLVNYPDDTESVRRIRDGIKHYNAAVGVVSTPTSGYHETLTRYYVHVVAVPVVHVHVVERHSHFRHERLDGKRGPPRQYPQLQPDRGGRRLLRHHPRSQPGDELPVLLGGRLRQAVGTTGPAAIPHTSPARDAPGFAVDDR